MGFNPYAAPNSFPNGPEVNPTFQQGNLVATDLHIQHKQRLVFVRFYKSKRKYKSWIPCK